METKLSSKKKYNVEQLQANIATISINNYIFFPKTIDKVTFGNVRFQILERNKLIDRHSQ